MKFEKFVKQLASSGTIYEDDNGDRWLASPTVYAKIPELTRSVTATKIEDAPPWFNTLKAKVGYTTGARLTRAIMPYGDGKIADCLRVYSGEERDISMTISNDDYGLLEKTDILEIAYKYDVREDSIEPVALMVKQYPKRSNDFVELVGIILPTEIPNDANY